MSRGYSKHGDGNDMFTFKGRHYAPVQSIRKNTTDKGKVINGQYEVRRVSKVNRVENEAGTAIEDR